MHKDTLYSLASQLQKEIRVGSLELNDLYIKTKDLKQRISAAFYLRSTDSRIYSEKAFLDVCIASKVVIQKERKKRLSYTFKIIKMLSSRGALQ